MGLGKQLKGLTKEYMTDPRGQYFRHLRKILELHKQSRVTRLEVIKYCQKWYDERK